jgi:hypothetical protein
MMVKYDCVFFKDKKTLSRECDKYNMQFSVAAMVLSVNANRLTFHLY